MQHNDVSGSSTPGPHPMRDALSQRMLRHCGVSAWREAFLGAANATLRFEARQYTLLASDAPLASFSEEEARLLAEHLGAQLQPSANVDLVLAFEQPSAALHAAMVLQRLGHRVRCALSTAMYTEACYESQDGPRRLVVGTALDAAEGALAQAVPGTIVLCAQSYALLAEQIGEHAPEGMLATEMEDETVRQASITLAPPASAALSTFAGLGLT
ncbi:MAG: hypothetical protein EOO25_15820 [Comamonadaceae bacterium]|nr:MAG: hypothetical protein EOO25_15820 [Comamonadaceae bacterium]